MARILVVDDSVIIRDLLNDLLLDEGHEVDLASNGEDALVMTSNKEYDLCICDLHMPKMNGHQLYLKASVAIPNLAFIFTDSLPDQLGQKLSSGAGQVVLRKPFDLDQLRDLLKKILTGSNEDGRKASRTDSYSSR